MKSCVSGSGLWAGLVLGLACVLGSALQLSASPQSGELFDARLFEEMRWRSIGPARGGRVLGVTGVRGEPEVYYFGAVGGGVWKTNDAGRNVETHFRCTAGGVDRSDSGGAVEPRGDLRGVG
jgi:hypothetical protein